MRRLTWASMRLLDRTQSSDERIRLLQPILKVVSDVGDAATGNGRRADPPAR
jgi:hypothetical protein